MIALRPTRDSPAADLRSPTPPPRRDAPALDAARFYDADYQPLLRAIVLDVVDREGPVTLSHLCKRVARQHGFQRTGAKIRAMVSSVIQDARNESRPDREETVIWPEGAEPKPWIQFRGLGDRTWDDVPLPEKVGLARRVFAAGSADLVDEMRARIGMTRLRSAMRAELETLLAVARAQLDAEDAGRSQTGNVSYLDHAPRGR